ncbi:MAG: ribosome biogenesis GTP-binding protein YihA/YsxC [Pseudomonadota bacterium]
MQVDFTVADPTADELAAGTALFKHQAEFLKGVVAMKGLPDADRLEVCFAGRSNVGKSSLINALTGRRTLARTSNTPGRTQEINFFTLGPKHYLVDVPGYGFANAPVNVVKTWQALLKRYLSGRVSLRRVFVLIDARHGPKPVDTEIMTMLSGAAVTFQAVLTKCDKLKSGDLDAVTARTAEGLRPHAAAFPQIVRTSSAKGDGVAALRAAIAGIV